MMSDFITLDPREQRREVEIKLQGDGSIWLRTEDSNGDNEESVVLVRSQAIHLFNILKEWLGA